MKRRDFIQSFGALASAVALPAFAARSAGDAFDAAVADKPWLKAFKGVSDATQDLQCDALKLSGHWPAELRGRFYRNGPALFERGGQRYRHWFDGDGMVQQFTFTGSAVSHRGRLVRTPKLLAEQRAGRFLYSSFGTPVASEQPVQGPDSFNTANTNAIEHAGRVLAMWEGGSAFALDPKDLSTLGPVTWKDGLQQVPFSAHPKLDPASGHLWNVGAARDKLVAWHIDAQGRLVDAHAIESPYPHGMVHDMAITKHHVVVPLPPVKLEFARVLAGEPLDRAFTFQPHEPLRILVMRKDDVTQRRVFELPALFVFHVGNAYERDDGSIALTFVGAKDHGFLVKGALELMRGDSSRSLAATTQSAILDMRRDRASVQALGDNVEFPRVDPRRIGAPARHLLTANSWAPQAGREGALLHGIALRDLHTGNVQRYDYGTHIGVEEHIVVPKPGRTGELDAWLVGTTFDARRQVTVVNVLDARGVADGPIAQATLPYALPLGFHGNFTPA
jgi:all-trans-8'-apo-beta-carotenal 15,15'-oxygenase